ncbi:deubiquitinase OTUD6B [Octopus sinensis]|uniref:ubiquitinyl hydrolase 1 n=1 Tax=Octopus sinensis TaxID=2607531 RepID=A0A6P7TSS8_9MOLL|nr:deubiquitinase OTUD6B [Octopus sinensis]
MEDDIVSEEDLLVRHRKEKKNLQAQVQKIKHSVPKGDKKRKKEATDEIAKLEEDLKKKHEEELAKLVASSNEKESVEEVGKGISKLTTDGDDNEPTEEVRKISKAQKRRDKKAAEEKERERRLKEQELENLHGDRHLESEKLRQILEDMDLCVHEIPSDGNCLYNAICHQLALKNIQTCNYSTLRTQTANYMLSHENDFLPFMTTKNSDSLCTSEEYQKICKDIATTPAWGGQIEIMALSHVLQVPINVIQAEGEPVKVGQEYDKDEIILTYHRHAFGLGEHYNSVKPLAEADNPSDSF